MTNNIDGLLAENRRMREAIEMTATQIRRCDYTPARSTLLTALSAAPQPPTADAIAQAVAAEREACAQVADMFEKKSDDLQYSIASDDGQAEMQSEWLMGRSSAACRIATAIRARAGQPTVTAEAPGKGLSDG